MTDDTRETLLPNRPSLSPSRIVVEADGRLTIDSESTSTPRSNGTTDATVEEGSVTFSDTDEEIEFNEWRRAHSLPDTEEDESKLIDSGRESEATDIITADAVANHEGSPQPVAEPKRSTTPRALMRTISNGNSAGRVVKRPSPRTAATKAHGAIAAPSTLTIPINNCGYMRPTKVANRRVSLKKRDKTSRQQVKDTIARSVSRRLSKDDIAKLTVPKPFHLHDHRRDARRSLSSEEIAGDGSAIPAQTIRLSKEAQEFLINKLTARRKVPAKETSPSTPPRTVTTATTEAAARKRTAAVKPKLTVPSTPQFAKSKRVRREVAEVPVDNNSQAHQPPTKPKAPATTANHSSSPLKLTVPQPFTFRSDAVAERHLTRLREEIAKLKAEEEALKQFRANPLPEFPTPQKPKVRRRTELHTSPFNLQTNSRGDVYQQQLRQRLEELENRRHERQNFVARPIPLSIDHPFVPQPSSAMPLTAIEEVLLKTELRSEERRAYDDDRKDRERIRDEVLARKRLEEARREEEEIKELRKLLVHKAQPVRHYKPLVVKPSDRPLTVPKTPQWHVRTRKLEENTEDSP